MDDSREEKIITKTSHKSRKENQSKSINDPRAESRKRFMEIPQNDPRIKLQDIPVSQAKERRQKGFKDKRMNAYNEEVMEDNKLLKQIKEAKDFKGISEIVANLIKMVCAYMENTQKEIENIKSIVDLEFASLKKPEQTIMGLEQKNRKQNAGNKQKNPEHDRDHQRNKA